MSLQYTNSIANVKKYLRSLRDQGVSYVVTVTTLCRHYHFTYSQSFLPHLLTDLQQQHPFLGGGGVVMGNILIAVDVGCKRCFILQKIFT